MQKYTLKMKIMYKKMQKYTLKMQIMYKIKKGN